MKTLILILFLSSAAYAFSSRPALPGCRTVKGQEVRESGPAGCLIWERERLLFVRQTTGKLNPPAGGSEDGEIASCTAHRETWEEAGVNVTVGKLLKRFENGFFLFQCHLDDSDRVREAFPVPATGVEEISEVLWVKPAELNEANLRFPKQLPILLELVKSLS